MTKIFICVIFKKMLTRIKKVLFCIFLSLLFSTSLRGEEKKACWKESLFADSPRLEYLSQQLAKRHSTHKLVDASPEKISNPILFKEDILFRLDKLEIDKTKFLFLKELSEALRSMRQKEKEIELLEAEKKYFSALSSFQPDTTPQANLWLEKELIWQKKEIEKRIEERRFYLEWLKNKLRSNDLTPLQEIVATPYKIFADIKTGFETEITKKRKELLEWENRYFNQRKEKYPRLAYYISLSSSLPYVFFYFPLPQTRDVEIYNILYERDKIELKLMYLTNLFAQEKIYLNLHYSLKKKEQLKTILDKIEEARKLSSSFEDLSSAKKMFLDISFSLENLEREIDSLKEDLLRYSPSLEKEMEHPTGMPVVPLCTPPSAGLSRPTLSVEHAHLVTSRRAVFSSHSSTPMGVVFCEGGIKPAIFIPDLKQLLKYAEENSLVLKSREKERAVLHKLITLYRGSIRNYLLSLAAYRGLLYEEEKIDLAQEVFGNWYCLLLASERYRVQKETRDLTKELYQIILNSSSRTRLEKKMKEIELLTQEMLLLEKEREMALNFLNLKETIKTPCSEDAINSLPAEKNILPDFDLTVSFAKFIPVQADLKAKRKDVRRELTEQELRLLAGGKGRILLSQKESVLNGDIELAFTLEVTAEMPPDIFKPQATAAANNFFSLKQKLLGEQEEKENLINSLLLKETEKRVNSLKQKISTEESLLNELEKGIFLASRERYIKQKIRTLNIKNKLLEISETYLEDFLTLKTTSAPSLSPAQENALLEKLSAILSKERIVLLNLIKKTESNLEHFTVFYGLQDLQEAKQELTKVSRTFEELLRIFSLKEKVGLILPEELSEMRLLKDTLEEEFFRLKRKSLTFKKKDIPKETLPQFDLALINAFREKYSPELEKEIIAQVPYLKIVELELRKFSSAGDYSFLAYLHKERKKQLKEMLRLLLKNLDTQTRILEIAKEKEIILENQLQTAFQGLREERLWLYGAYGLNSIFLKYIDGLKRLYDTRERLRANQINLWGIINPVRKGSKRVPDPAFTKRGFALGQAREYFSNGIKSTKGANFLSIIPADITSRLKNVLLLFKDSYSPFVQRERAKRRQDYILKNYQQKIHALNFFLEEKTKEKKLKIKRGLFRAAHEKEFKTAQYLDRLWDKEKGFREKIKKEIEESGIDIRAEISSLGDALEIEEKDRDILALLFIQYAKRFHKENYLKKYIEDIVSLIRIFPVSHQDVDKMPQWWAKYTSAILPYPEKTYLEEIIDPRLLGLYLYYTQLKQFLGDEGDETLQSLDQRLRQDKPFLFLDLYHLPIGRTEEYLSWESEIRKELDRITLSHWSREEWEGKRKRVARQARALFGFLYGSVKDRVIQEEVLAWLICSGVKETDYPNFFSLMEEVAKKIKKFFSPLSREEKLSLNEAVRLRWLFYSQENVLIEKEEKKLEEAIFLGNLLSWSNLFWTEKIALAEIDLFFHFMERLRNEPLFQEIFGEYTHLTPSQRNFYISSLSYWAKNWLKLYREDPLQAEATLKQHLARFRFIYSLPSFQAFYGPFKLCKVEIEKGEARKRLREFMGKLGFFVDWTQNFSLTEGQTKLFFDDLLTLISHKDYLEDFYKNQGIEVKLTWEEPKEKEEAMGILINWLQFFQYRGIEGRDGLVSALKEIGFIQKKSQQYGLRFSIDEIRYWWEKTHLKGYELKFIERIFENISLVKELLPEVCQDLIQQINSSPLSSWETPPLRKEFIEFLKDKASSALERAEIHNLAEKIMPAFALDFGELKKEYAERIYLETAYYVFKKERPLPPIIIQFHTIMKERGYSLAEMGNFIYLYTLFRQDERLINSSASDLEIFGLINHLFTQPPPYEKRFISWLNKASTLALYFHKEHQRPLDFSLLKTLMNYPLLRMRPWQIRRLVEKGALSRNSPDMEIREVNSEEDFRRFILRLFWENRGEIISEEDIAKFSRIAHQSNMEEAELRTAFKQLSEKLSLFHHCLTIIIKQILYEKRLSFEEIFLKSEKIMREIEEIILPYLLPHILSKRESIFRERQRKIISLKRPSPSIKRTLPSIPFENRISIEKTLREKARKIYGVELPPHKSASLVWKVLEGLGIEETLKIYIEDRERIERLYREIFGPETFDFEDIQVISYFAEEINLGTLNEAILPELFLLCREVKESFQENFGKSISIQEALDYAWPGLYSGVTPESLEEIFAQARFIHKLLKETIPLDKSEDGLLQDILHILTQTYGIQLLEKTYPSYDREEYVHVLQKMVDYLDIDKREINQKGLKETAENLMFLLQPPATFLSLAKKTKYLHTFIQKNLHKEISPKEILFYLDLAQKDSLNFLNLKGISYGILPSKVIIQKVGDALALAFKNFIKENL